MDIVEIETYSDALREALSALLPQLSAAAPALSEAALRRIIAAEAVHLFMAVDAGRYCGALTLVIMDLPTGRRARIEDVVVAEAMRGRGIGRMLIDRAIKAACAMGAAGIDLTSRPSRLAANSLYTKMGFRQRETNSYGYPLSPAEDF